MINNDTKIIVIILIIILLQHYSKKYIFYYKIIEQHFQFKNIITLFLVIYLFIKFKLIKLINYKTLLFLYLSYLIIYFLFKSSNLRNTDSIKSYTLDYLPKDYILSYFIIDKKKQRIKNIKQILKSIKYPIVFKPNYCTQNGKGVRKINNYKDAVNYIIKTPVTQIMVQELCNNKYYPIEATILYERNPTKKKGKIKSVVQKISKDFIHSAETSKLINRDNWITYKLEHIVNNMSTKIPEFYVGRYDIKIKSINDFKDGKFKIIELNGANGVDLKINTINNLILKSMATCRWIFIRVYYGIINLSDTKKRSIIMKNLDILSLMNPFDKKCLSLIKDKNLLS